LVDLFPIAVDSQRLNSTLALEENIVDHFCDVLLSTNLHLFNQLLLAIDFRNRTWRDRWRVARRLGREWGGGFLECTPIGI
jgi:hypothetical protein